NFLLVPRYGIVVAAAVTVFTEVLILVGSYPLMRRYFGFFPSLHMLVPAVAAAGVMGGSLWLLRSGPLAALLPLGAALYAGLIWAVSPSTRELVSARRT